ncbi:3519_t:CDS:1, partial [Paraglomus brasilianum]
ENREGKDRSGIKQIKWGQKKKTIQIKQTNGGQNDISILEQSSGKIDIWIMD